MEPPKDHDTDDTVYIGKKEIDVYIAGAVMLLKHHDPIKIKARGGRIPVAIDVANHMTQYSNIPCKVGMISTGAEEKMGDHGRSIYISSIDIRIDRLPDGKDASSQEGCAAVDPART